MPMLPRSPKLPPGVRRLFRLPQSRGVLLREMDEELAAHLAMRVEDLRRLGMSQADAEAEARRRFGDAEAFRDYAARRAGRRARRFGAARWLSEGAQDVRVALRQFRQAPALAAVVVLTLALCIGATTAAYGIVRHLLLAPLPYSDGNRIVSLEARSDGDGDVRWHVGAELYRLWAARARTLEDFAALDGGRYPVGDGGAGSGAVDSADVSLVTPSFFPMLRVSPVLGRGFVPDDARRGAPAVAMIGDAVWQSRFGGAPDVVGRSLTVNGVPRTIVGVVARGVGAPIQGEEPPAVWLPLNVDSATGVAAFARLRPGVTSATASRELHTILRTLPDTGWLYGRRAEALTAPERVDPQRRRAVEVLFAAAGGLLLLACADVAGLLLMRGWARRREFAVRRALGAWRGRLARQLLTESLLLAAPSGALGLLVAWLGLRAVGAIGPGAVGYVAEVHLDASTFLWTAAASVATALLFGVGPALMAGSRSVDAALRTGGAGAGVTRAAGRAHAGLVVGQIALSLVFLATAGVLGRSFVALVRTPVGYEPAGLYAVHVRPAQPSARRLAPGERVAVARALREALAATPGVREVAIGTQPLTNYAPGPTAVDGLTGVRPAGVPITGMAYVSPEYFRVARIPLVRGWGFDPDPAAAGEVVVNRALARRLWPDRDAVGARLRLGDGADAMWLTVVGVAGDVRMPGPAPEFFGLQMYRPAGAAPQFDGALVLRAAGDAATLRPQLARAVERAGVAAVLHDVVATESTLEFAYRGPRFALALFGAFALLAVALAAVGLFGIVAYAVARRTREIGIRVALGADPAALTSTILGQSLRLVAVGCGIGLLGAYGASHALTALVYGVSPTDPRALGGAVALLAVIALAASAIPVRRALRVDPADTLRAE